MKTARRHELKENDLAHWLEQAVEWASANAKLIVLAVVGVCAVVAAWFYFQQRSRQNAAAAWDQEYAAEFSNDTQKLEQFVNTHKNTAAGQLANLHLADIAFDEAIGQMSVDREQALKRLNDAKNRYYEVEQGADDTRIEQRAMLGMGRCFESIGDLPKAKEYYEKLAKIEDGLFRQEAERKVAELSRPVTEEFVKWYSALAPKPQAAGTNPLVQSKLGDVPGFPAATDTAPTSATPAGTAPTSATPTGTVPTSATPTGTAPTTPTATGSPTAIGSATAAGSATPTGSPTATGSSAATGAAK